MCFDTTWSSNGTLLLYLVVLRSNLKRPVETSNADLSVAGQKHLFRGDRSNRKEIVDEFDIRHHYR